MKMADWIKDRSFFRKENSLSPEKLAETGVRLSGLEKRYRQMIRMETERVRAARNNRKEDARAEAKLKNAYYALSIVRAAREQLHYVSTVEALREAMNEMDTVLNMLNTAYGKTAKVGGRNLKKRAAQVAAAQEEDGRLASLFAQPIDVLVDDDVLERLARGDSVDDCLDQEDSIKVDVHEAVAYSQAYMAQAETDDSLKGNPDESLYSDLESIREMVGNMVRDA